jgi:signal transduction histidine kinase
MKAPSNLTLAPGSLRAAITAGLALVTFLAALSALLLIVLTTRLRWTGERVAQSVRSLRVAQEAEIELLLHARATDLTLRSSHEASVRRLVARVAQSLAASDHDAFSSVQEAIERYFTASPRPEAMNGEALSEAFAALEDLVDVTVERSAAALAEAERADRFANTAGLVTLLAVIPLASGLTWWLWRRAFEPFLGLGHAMQQFAAGQHDARARASGPLELRQMAERFNEMAAELARRREAQAAFLGGVAHDLRNPLSPLKLAATALAERTSAPVTGEVRTLARVVARQVDHLDRIVGDLLDVARLEAGRLDLRLQDADLAALAAEVVELYRPAAIGHDLRSRLPEGPAWVRGDPVRLQQVLNNLLSNAIKYSPHGGPVLVTVSVDSDRVHVSVADEGIGMAEEEVRRLFAPFQRAREACDSRIPGAGLGLYVARRIVEAHGGELAVRSAPGAGTVFSVALPAAAPAPAYESAARRG